MLRHVFRLLLIQQAIRKLFGSFQGLSREPFLNKGRHEQFSMSKEKEPVDMEMFIRQQNGDGRTGAAHLGVFAPRPPPPIALLVSIRVSVMGGALNFCFPLFSCPKFSESPFDSVKPVAVLTPHVIQGIRFIKASFFYSANSCLSVMVPSSLLSSLTIIPRSRMVRPNELLTQRPSGREE